VSEQTKTIDMVESPIDGKLVVVSVVNGAHVCAACWEPVHVGDSRDGFKPTEKHIDGARVLVHAKCIHINADARLAEPKLIVVSAGIGEKALETMRRLETAGRDAFHDLARRAGFRQ
jgi:hypothetical protein